MSLREKKKAWTRQAIVAEALELFREQGFDATTADEIAAAARVSRSTFFRYFATKEAVMFDGLSERYERFVASLDRHEGLPPLDRIEQACLEMATHYMEHRQIILLRNQVIDASRTLLPFEVQFDARWETLFYETLLEPGDEDDGARVLLARLTAGIVIGAIRTALRLWIESEGRDDLITLGRDAFRLVRNLEHHHAR